MTQKQIAIVRTTDDARFRVKTWRNKGKARPGYPKWPATIQRWDGSEWQFVDEWELKEDEYQLPRDKEVLKTAIRRIKNVHTVGITEILYDQSTYESEVIGGYEITWL